MVELISRGPRLDVKRWLLYFATSKGHKVSVAGWKFREAFFKQAEAQIFWYDLFWNCRTFLLFEWTLGVLLRLCKGPKCRLPESSPGHQKVLASDVCMFAFQLLVGIARQPRSTEVCFSSFQDFSSMHSSSSVLLLRRPIRRPSSESATASSGIIISPYFMTYRLPLSPSVHFIHG